MRNCVPIPAVPGETAQYAAATRLNNDCLWNTGRFHPVKPGDDTALVAGDGKPNYRAPFSVQDVVQV